ncbi:MAG: hypothetical protein SF097_00980 [Acidobacteriota bacterium]|nr:hypothetical protein [Acidobacteriota bacterium]
MTDFSELDCPRITQIIADSIDSPNQCHSRESFLKAYKPDLGMTL